jgi:D-tagatose-1,6-bisphosphate aldolase subunit GatZ/KbaZ
MREAILALAEIETLTVAPDAQSQLPETIRTVMREKPGHWQEYYSGSDTEIDLLLFNSYSDRIRYYWPDPQIAAALARLVANLTAAPPSDILLSRYLPGQYQRVRAGELSRDPETLVRDKIRDTLRPYAAACRA